MQTQQDLQLLLLQESPASLVASVRELLRRVVATVLREDGVQEFRVPVRQPVVEEALLLVRVVCDAAVRHVR